MAQLSTVIGSILRDMIVAQHQANMYAVSLEEVYKQNGRLEKFSLPTVAVGEVELNLRYGVEEMSKGEGNQLNLFVRFLQGNKWDVYLRKLDWKEFARHYNGSEYAKNQYDKKLEKAYQKYK